MIFPADTAIFAGLFGLIYIGLTLWVMMSRTNAGVLEVGGDDTVLAKRIRAHGNFSEYVPFALVLMGLWEAAGGRHGRVLTALVLLLIGRILHPFGLFAPLNSAGMFACRGGGMILTLLAILIASLALLHDFL